MIAAARMAHVDHGNGAVPMGRQMEEEDPLRRVQALRLRRAAQTAGPAIRCNSQQFAAKTLRGDRVHHVWRDLRVSLSIGGKETVG
jgi:hypothetical protein